MQEACKLFCPQQPYGVLGMSLCVADLAAAASSAVTINRYCEHQLLPLVALLLTVVLALVFLASAAAAAAIAACLS